MPQIQPLPTPYPVIFVGGTFKKQWALGTEPGLLTQEEDLGPKPIPGWRGRGSLLLACYMERPKSQ